MNSVHQTHFLHPYISKLPAQLCPSNVHPDLISESQKLAILIPIRGSPPLKVSAASVQIGKELKHSLAFKGQIMDD